MIQTVQQIRNDSDELERFLEELETKIEELEATLEKLDDSICRIDGIVSKEVTESLEEAIELVNEIKREI